MRRQLVWYGLGKMGQAIRPRLNIEFDTFEGASRADHRILRDPDGRPCSLAGLTRPIALVCVPPSVAPSLIAAMLPSLAAGSTVIDLGNTDPDETARLAHDACVLGVNYLGVGVACGPAMATEHCSLTVGESQDGYATELDDVLRSIAGHDGRYAVVGPPFAGHMGKVLFNPAGYVCTYAVAGACSVLLEYGLGPRSTAEVVRQWCEDGLDSYLARVAIACLEDGRFEKVGESIADQQVPHSGVGRQWSRLMADCEYLPPVTAAAVSTRIGHEPFLTTRDLSTTLDSVMATALRVYNDTFCAGICELRQSVTRVAQMRDVPLFERCGASWEVASLVSGNLYTLAASLGDHPTATVEAAVLARALAAQRPLVALMRHEFGGHALVTSGGSGEVTAR